MGYGTLKPNTQIFRIRKYDITFWFLVEDHLDDVLEVLLVVVFEFLFYEKIMKIASKMAEIFKFSTFGKRGKKS